jgi:hypothetical protein
MDQIDYPSKMVWEARQSWFESVFDNEQRLGSYIIGEHAIGILVDLQSIYCAGAFVSTIVISCTIIDSHLREAELEPDFEGGIRAVFGQSVYKVELDWLRRRRNKLVHFRPNAALAVSVDDHWINRGKHEGEAKRAICLVANVLFENSWT